METDESWVKARFPWAVIVRPGWGRWFGHGRRHRGTYRVQLRYSPLVHYGGPSFCKTRERAWKAARQRIESKQGHCNAYLHYLQDSGRG